MSPINQFKSLVSDLTLAKKPRSKRKSVNITADIKNVTVKHGNHNMLIKRGADNDATIDPMYAKTSRPCPPFCVQPMHIHPGVETIGELEMLDYLKDFSDNKESFLIVDSRMQDWFMKGTIPCAINIPWTKLVPSQGASDEEIISILNDKMGVTSIESKGSDSSDSSETINFDFSSAKTLIMFCNGTWCGQTSESIKALITKGYPIEKIKYFRNGMQGWMTLGLTTISAKELEPRECKIR